MSNPIMPIDLDALESVTGGSSPRRSSYGSSEQLLNDLGSLATSIKDVTAKTSGFDSTQMMMFVMLAMRNQSPNVVYVGRSRCW